MKLFKQQKWSQEIAKSNHLIISEIFFKYLTEYLQGKYHLRVLKEMTLREKPTIVILFLHLGNGCHSTLCSLSENWKAGLS